MKKKIISFSLWGNNPKYTIGAIKNLELASVIYPDWICRFYVDESVPKDIIKTLSSFANSEIIKINGDGNWNSVFWRFYACEDADIMLSRDTDSRLSIREKVAVDEWLSSDKDFHIMRDHPFHATQIPGGMWGCRNNILYNIREMIDAFPKGNYWQVDQIFLREKIYPLIIDKALIHDEFHNFENKKSKFKTRRIKNEFVGEVNDEYDRKPFIPKLFLNLPFAKLISGLFLKMKWHNNI